MHEKGIFPTPYTPQRHFLHLGKPQDRSGSPTPFFKAGGKTITIPSIHACHYVLKVVTTAVFRIYG
ncbi:hypothetical protein I8752_36810 [Nostocaceae cyanobacterium CENA369]|uniref:Uncharacterized protein n=1 Tax=Dendronalium phyllosphericum CENA369 TaxID=1725256 RepID=A0A8J7IWJ4_9NOST|nr:hypothetical protein [Dendronalium phyllosphericum CENA369]